MWLQPTHTAPCQFLCARFAPILHKNCPPLCGRLNQALAPFGRFSVMEESNLLCRKPAPSASIPKRIFSAFGLDSSLIVRHSFPLLQLISASRAGRFLSSIAERQLLLRPETPLIARATRRNKPYFQLRSVPHFAAPQKVVFPARHFG